MTIAAVENDGHLDRRVGSLTFWKKNGKNQTSGGFLKIRQSALLNYEFLSLSLSLYTCMCRAAVQARVSCHHHNVDYVG